MILFAIKMLMGDRLKYIGLVAGIAFAALLITQQASILVGLTHQTGAFIRDTSQGDIWVMDEQVRFSQDTLGLPDTTLYRVRGVDGVEWAVPLYQGFLKARLADGSRQTVILVGVDDATFIGAPPEMVEGKITDLREDKAVIVDVEAAQEKLIRKRGDGAGAKVGDLLDINDNEARIVGIYKGSKSFFWEPMIFTTYSRALKMAPRERKLTAYVIAKVQPGYDKKEVAARIESATGLKARTNAEFEQSTADYILKETGILVNFGLAVGLGFIIGMLVVGQMLYNFTIDNLRYFGTLKAMGATNWLLIAMVLVQALTVGAIGYGIGVGAGAVLGEIVGQAGLAFLLPWQIVVFTAVSTAVICVLAALLSVIRVLRLEPAIVFKS